MATGRPRRTKLVSQLPNPVLPAASGSFSMGHFPENKIQVRYSQCGLVEPQDTRLRAVDTMSANRLVIWFFRPICNP